jgi:hypothetical protein
MSDDEDDDMAELADKVVDAALNGDKDALREVSRQLGELEDGQDDEPMAEESNVAKAGGLTLHRHENETLEHAAVAAAIRPTTLAAAAEYSLLSYGRIFENELSLDALAEVLRAQVQAVTNHNLERGEGMLAAQAHTLDAIYNVLLRKALRQEHGPHLEMFFKIALRAQAQCRATWEAISTIQNPPIAGYVGQANIAAGPQQVNNETNTRAGAGARANQNARNKLLEQTNGERLDTGATCTTGSADPQMEAVGAVERTEDRRRESESG